MFHYDDINEHPFSAENRRYESGAADVMESRWMQWLRTAERLTGLTTLDGDQDTEGYSLDSAYDFWEKGESPAAYVIQANAERQRLGLSKLEVR